MAADLSLALTLRLGARRTLSPRIDAALGRLALVGPSGAGKSTLIAAIVGALPRTRHQGTIRLGDAVWLDTEARAWTPSQARGVGWSPQDAALLPHLSVRQNLCFGVHAPDAPPAELVEQLGLSGLLERQPRHLSGGEAQRVSVGRALLAATTIVALDEPFAPLDRALTLRLIDWLPRWCDARDLGLIFTSHDPRDVEALATQRVELP